MSEVLGVFMKYILVAIAVAAAVSIGYYAQDSGKIDAAISDMTAMSDGVRRLFMGQADYAALSNTEIMSDDPSLVPNDWGGWVNQWGGWVRLYSGSAASTLAGMAAIPGGNSQFVIDFYPPASNAVCIKMLSSRIGTGTVYGGRRYYGWHLLPMTVANATANCAGNATGLPMDFLFK